MKPVTTIAHEARFSPKKRVSETASVWAPPECSSTCPKDRADTNDCRDEAEALAHAFDNSLPDFAKRNPRSRSHRDARHEKRQKRLEPKLQD